LVCIELLAKCVNRTHFDADIQHALRNTSEVETTIFPNVAAILAVTTEQIMQEHVSRRTMSHAQIRKSLNSIEF